MKKFSYYWVSLIVIILDQLSKWIVRQTIELGEIIRVTKKFFWLTYVQNTGAAFSISFGNVALNKVLFIVITLVAVGLLIYLSTKSKSKVEKLSFALIMGGAIGNLIDRIALGSVTDFIWWDFPDFIMQRWPVFNLADSSIVVAVTIMIGYELFFNKKETD